MISGADGLSTLCDFCNAELTISPLKDEEGEYMVHCSNPACVGNCENPNFYAFFMSRHICELLGVALPTPDEDRNVTLVKINEALIAKGGIYAGFAIDHRTSVNASLEKCLENLLKVVK